MTEHKTHKPDYVFETSWEVCNKVGGIYTIISTKALSLVKEHKDNFILIGPDVWRETHENPEFIEDKFLFKSWREKAEKEGLHFRIGRWNIAGTPVVILVDFTPYFSIKDKVFTDLWKSYKLDSLTGGWDYVEPALFGYAAAKVIESFYEFYISSHEKLVAHFHEWMTGTGILYLKEKVPQAACVFTTHATVVGRSIAGNSLPFYSEFSSYHAESIANRFGILSKFSLERLSAQESDAFTTVSEITAKECDQFLNKPVDVVTPNGFDQSFVPADNVFENKRSIARNRLIEVAEAMFNQKISSDCTLVINSGRYEFRNKGIDLFIDALGRLNKSDLQKPVVAFITVPANHAGACKELVERINRCDFKQPITDRFLTHRLYENDTDPVLRRIKENNLRNLPEDKVKIIFVPSYLNGDDGVLNMSYYDLLIGFDISVFPSYYEPWGYTPLESIAFKIPTVTTSLSGFGLWVKSLKTSYQDGVMVIERNDFNDEEVTQQILTSVKHFAQLGVDERNKAREVAHSVANQALWDKLIEYYIKAYSLAIGKAELRHDSYKSKKVPDHIFTYTNGKYKKPEWKKIFVHPSIPKKLSDLQKLSENLWWAWNYEAIDLFESIDKPLWEKVQNNPIALLHSLTYEDFQRLEEDEEFLNKLKTVANKFKAYIGKSTEKSDKQVAYFSMEYGLCDAVKTFSGGLGILAGDYLKEASDCNANIVGVGLLYRYGYFTQNLSLIGDQLVSYQPQRFTQLPLIPVRDDKGDWIKISLALPGRILYAKVWKVEVGRVPLYLLDTDIDENTEVDRVITHQLYGGDNENRFKQELLLGVGGIRMLDALGIKPDIYHCNEGHAAFIGVERLRKYVQVEKFSFYQAMELVRSSALFTTHTPVPAGHDAFSEDILRTYIPHYADRLNVNWDTFMNLGKYHDGDPNEKFSMSVLATKLSSEVNGVSKLHGDVSKKMFRDLYPGYFPSEIHIGYVTNGVHYPTWTHRKWQMLYAKEFGNKFLDDQSNSEHWKKIHNVSDELIWKTRQALRKELIDYIKVRLTEDLTRRQEDPKLIFKIMESFNENALTIGFARRFATYKRAHLLFENLDHLAQVVGRKDKPVQLIFAGKAHPNDKAGQDLIKKIVEVSKMPQFIGKITFIENYDIELAKKLVQGVDIWLNTPTRLMEASGTSGQKAAMNGVLNFSVLDGWWYEGYRANAGWAITDSQTYENNEFQNELDAEVIYNVIEDEIIPLFYTVDSKQVPFKWVSYIKNNIAEIAPHYTMKRMLIDYQEKYYNKLFERSKHLEKNEYKLVRQVASWKRKVINAWDNIEVVELNIPDPTVSPLKLGDAFNAQVLLNLHELSADDIGVEMIAGQKEKEEVKQISFVEEMKLMKVDKNIATYSCKMSISKAGVYDYVFRVFPKNTLLPHRQDFSLVKWI